MRHLLHELAPDHLTEGVPRPEREVLFRFEKDALTDGQLEK